MIQTSIKNSKRAGRPRSGFSLPELLIVIAIIGVLSSLGLSMMVEARDSARESATRSRIQQIEAILQIQLEDYEVRRLPISTGELTGYVGVNRIDPDPVTGVPVRVQVKNLRRRILADLIFSEVPAPGFDGVNFVNNPDLGVFPTTIPPADAVPPFNAGFGAWMDLNYPNPIVPGGLTLRERLAVLKSGEIIRWESFKNAVPYIINPANGIPNEDFNLPGEYLYQILLRTDFEGVSGVETLGSSAVGDSDGDGFLEIVDSWGESMQLRILQVGIDLAVSTPADDLWVDLPTDWTFEDPTNNFLPTGYTVINPVIPRSIQKIRFQVVSPHLDAY